MSIQGVEMDEKSIDDADGQMPVEEAGPGALLIDRRIIARLLDDKDTALTLSERALHLLTMYADEVDRLRKQSRELAQELLLQKMCEISEECYRAGWMDGLENSLWRIMQARGGHYGQGLITGREAEHLKKLSDTCGGWWHFPNGADYPQFITLKEWEGIYES